MLFYEIFFYDENWLFDDFDLYFKEIESYQYIQTYRTYDYWAKKNDEKFVEKIFERFKSFIDSKEN